MSQEIVDLSVITLACAVFGFAVVRPIVGPGPAAVVTALKLAVPFVYFVWFFDGTWVLEDDTTYLREARALIEQGLNPLSIWSSEGLRALDRLVEGGLHVLYIWWNFVAQYLFGQHYFSPVILNVALTFPAAAGLYGLARLTGFDTRYATLLMVFFLLHWDVVAWSSFQNRKEIFILTLTIGLFFGLVGACFGNRSPREVLGYGGVALLCFVGLGMSRFYVTVLVVVALGAWYLISRSRRGALPVSVAVVFGLGVSAYYFLPDEMSGELSHITLDWSQVLWGLVRFPLTPRPWGIEVGYTFVTLGAWIHWLLFLPMLYGALRLWKDSEIARMLLLYAVVVVGFYAFVPFLQDDRHRVQIVFVLAWCQFHFFATVFRGLMEQRQVGVTTDR